MGWNWQYTVGVYKEGDLESKSAMIKMEIHHLRTTCLLHHSKLTYVGEYFHPVGFVHVFSVVKPKGLRCKPLDLNIDSLFWLVFLPWGNSAQTTTKGTCTNSISRFLEWLTSQQVLTPYL